MTCAFAANTRGGRAFGVEQRSNRLSAQQKTSRRLAQVFALTWRRRGQSFSRFGLIPPMKPMLMGCSSGSKKTISRDLDNLGGITRRRG